MPIGNQRISDQGYMHLGGDLLLARGLGDLADSPPLFRYLRPLAIQVEAGYAGRIEGPANSDVFTNLELEYSFRYLDNFVERVRLQRPFVNLVPYAQLNYSQSFIAAPSVLNSGRSSLPSPLTVKPDFRLTPGLAYLGDYFEMSVGAQVALNGAAARGDRVAALGLIEIFYDNIFPALRWSPF